MSHSEPSGQLNAEERRILTAAVIDTAKKPQIVLEVGTWLGGGSTLHFLRALQQNGEGHLWAVEADRSIYERMIANIAAAAPEAANRFTPLFGLSQEVIPRWLKELGPEARIDMVFLDGGDNPMEQIAEFKMLADRIPIDGRLLAHDAKLRKGKWLRPYLNLLDNWQVEMHDISSEGLLDARKVRELPSPDSLRKAEFQLFKMRLQPTELAGRFLPKRLCDVLLKAMPEKVRLRVSQGR